MNRLSLTPPLPSVSIRRWSRAPAVRVLAGTMLLCICVAATISGAAGEQSAGATVAGESLGLQAKGTRSKLFGAVDIYTVGVYAAREVNSVEGLRDPQLTRAVRVQVVYDGGMPVRIPSEWWQELVPVLDKQQQKKLREAFERLSPGQDVWITYALSQGTLVYAGGQTVLTDPGDALINAVLNLWLGATPVSRDMRDALVSDLRRSGRQQAP